MSGSVLVLTRRMDPTADVVVDELNRRAIPVIRFDLGEVVVAAELVGSRWVGQLRAGSRCARLEDAVGVYYRRPSAPTAPSGTDPQVVAWVEAEARWGLRGLLVALPRGLWFNWPPAVHAAEHKPWQLVEAVAAGLRVPRTVITNDPESAAGFASDAAPVLYKAFRAEPVCLGGKTHLVYATPVDAQQCRSESIRAAPVMLQTQIDKAFDARVTCVDGHVFAVTPRGVGGVVPLDWRVDHAGNQWQVVTVPDQVRVALLELLDRLGLRFAACDFSVDHSGVWWHLEVNPAGQWAWDHPLRDTIASAIADALTGETTPP